MHEHAKDLRAEVQDIADPDAWVESVKTDYRQAALESRDRRMVEFAVKLTLRPREMTEADVSGLRDAGFDDATVHDIAQVTALFNYYNRLADGLGIDPEP